MDSIVTSSGNVIFAGGRKSVYWGKASLSTYLTFKTTEDYSQSSSPEYESEYLFDSLTLYLTPDFVLYRCDSLKFIPFISSNSR